MVIQYQDNDNFWLAVHIVAYERGYILYIYTDYSYILKSTYFTGKSPAVNVHVFSSEEK